MCMRCLHSQSVFSLCAVFQAGKVTVTLTVTDCAEPARAIFCYDTRHNLPRCITATGGSDDLDAINKKVSFLEMVLKHVDCSAQLCIFI